MKILSVGQEWHSERAGGSNRYFCDLNRYLVDAGHDVRGLVIGEGAAERETGGKIFSCAPINSSIPTRMRAIHTEFKKLWNESKPDVVASHFSLYALPILHQIDRKTPFVVHFHGPWNWESRVNGGNQISCAAKKLLERVVYSRASKLVTLSVAFKKILVESFSIPERKISVVPAGVWPDSFAPVTDSVNARHRLNLPEAAKIVLCVRRLVKRMGHENLIKGFLQASFKDDVRLVIVGTGPEKAALDNLISRLGLAGRVQMLGYLEEHQLRNAYTAADFTIVPTLSLEGFGLIAVESLAAGVPCIVTPVDGLPEIVRPFDPEFILGGSTAEDIKVGLEKLLNKPMASGLPDKCRSYVNSNFHWKIAGSRIEAEYQSAVNAMRNT